MSEVIAYVSENREALLAAFAALNVFAAMVAKLTPNKKDDQLVAKISKVLDYITLSVRK